MTPETTNEFLVCPSRHITPKEVTYEPLTLSVTSPETTCELSVYPVSVNEFDSDLCVQFRPISLRMSHLSVQFQAI